MCCLIKRCKHFTHILLILTTTSRSRSCYFSHLYTQGNGTRGPSSISLRAMRLVVVPAGFALGGLTMEAVVGTTPLTAGRACSLFSAQATGFMAASFLNGSWPVVAALAPGPLHFLPCCFCIGSNTHWPSLQESLYMTVWQGWYDVQLELAFGERRGVNYHPQGRTHPLGVLAGFWNCRSPSRPDRGNLFNRDPLKVDLTFY